MTGAAQKRGTALEFHQPPAIAAHLWMLQGWHRPWTSVGYTTVAV